MDARTLTFLFVAISEISSIFAKLYDYFEIILSSSQSIIFDVLLKNTSKSLSRVENLLFAILT